MGRVLAKGMHAFTRQLTLKDGLLFIVGHLQVDKGHQPTCDRIRGHPNVDHLLPAEVTPVSDDLVAQTLHPGSSQVQGLPGDVQLLKGHCVAAEVLIVNVDIISVVQGNQVWWLIACQLGAHAKTAFGVLKRQKERQVRYVISNKKSITYNTQNQTCKNKKGI